jgi:hypothetical protein
VLGRWSAARGLAGDSGDLQVTEAVEKGNGK